MNTTIQKPIDIEPRLRAFLEETLLPSPNTVELMRTPQSDYRFRFAAASAPHIAELFQENTKLSPHSSFDAAINERELSQARDYYFATAYQVAEADFIPGKDKAIRITHEHLPAWLRSFLSPFSVKDGISSLLYGVDMLLIFDGAVYKQAPRSIQLWRERALSPSDLANFRAAIMRGPDALITAAEAFAILVGVPWRYMAFLGPRGYRRMMLEAGMLLAQLGGIAAHYGLHTAVCTDFYDTHVDRILLLDGVERTAIAILPLLPKPHANPKL